MGSFIIGYVLTGLFCAAIAHGIGESKGLARLGAVLGFCLGIIGILVIHSLPELPRPGEGDAPANHVAERTTPKVVHFGLGTRRHRPRRFRLVTAEARRSMPECQPELSSSSL